MVIKFDGIGKGSPKPENKGSSAALVNYLGKEDELNHEQWFSYDRDECHPAEVRAAIDSDHQGVGKSEGKFASGSINPTAEEWKALGKSEKERLENFKSWVQKDFSQELANNFKKTDKSGNVVTIEPQNVKIYYKVEHDRYYTGRDKEVKEGLKMQGEPKEGFNTHCHFIVARKTKDGQNRISPTGNNGKEFNRNNLIGKVEQSFDKRAGYERQLNQTFDYAKTMKNGTGAEKVEMIQKSTVEKIKHEGYEREIELVRNRTDYKLQAEYERNELGARPDTCTTVSRTNKRLSEKQIQQINIRNIEILKRAQQEWDEKNEQIEKKEQEARKEQNQRRGLSR